MKKSSIIVAGMISLSLASCGNLGTGSTTTSGTDILSGVLGAITNGNTVSDVLTSVIGLDKPTQQQIIGTWRYSQPGVAFTSDKLLAKAGGEVVASQIKEKLKSHYDKVGFSNSNTLITLNSDNTFSAKIDGKALSGTYTYDQNECKITFKTLLFSLPCYAKGTTNGMSFLFESKKLLSMLQTVAAVSGNANLQTIGELSQNYEGVRMGFDMRK